MSAIPRDAASDPLGLGGRWRIKYGISSKYSSIVHCALVRHAATWSCYGERLNVKEVM